MKATKLFERTLGGFPVQPLELGLDEALKLDAPGKTISDPEMQGRAERIKTGTKTPKEKMGAYIHASNITKSDDPNDVWNLDALRKRITTRPTKILGKNAKVTKSGTETEEIWDLTLPALKGIVVDEETGEFVEITTCPKAGECQLYCYARKGGYVMFPESSMSAARGLNFLVNDPEGYAALLQSEITKIKAGLGRKKKKLVVRWHDSGDFFSKQYIDLAFDIARANPDVKFYAYTKVADLATGDKPSNFLINFSTGAKRSEVIQIEKSVGSGNLVKQAITVPNNLFLDLISRDKKSRKIFKDEKGRTQFINAEAENEFKDRLANKYGVKRDSIVSYDEMMEIPEGDEPKWNVIVQPGAGDRAANRKDVIISFLLWH